jgi:hypothetical protein
MTLVTWRGALVSLFALVASSLANATPIPTYKVVDLGFTGTALNNRGQVVGCSSTGAILRDRTGAIHELGSGEAVDVNEFGQVLGNDNGHAWIWDPVFGRRDFEFGGASAMNDRGQFVGFVGPGDPNFDFEGYRWDPIFGLTALPRVRGEPWPLDLNNQSTVVGYDGAGVFGPAFVVKNGVPTTLTVMESLGVPVSYQP